MVRRVFVVVRFDFKRSLYWMLVLAIMRKNFLPVYGTQIRRVFENHDFPVI